MNLFKGLVVCNGVVHDSDVVCTRELFKVSGTVKDNTGELVIGATVIDTKTKNGCVTDVDGNFSFRGDAKFVD